MNTKNEIRLLEDDEIMALTADIVASFVGNNPVAVDNLPDLITSVHKTVAGLATEKTEVEPERPKPAVPVSKSITDDHIICLEDGKKLKMLKRYLRSQYNLTPDEYRKRWNLPSDYPMVAPSYTRERSSLAKKIGLGRTGGRG